MTNMLDDEISKKLESKINNKLISKAKRGKILDGFKSNKVINEVLDKTTMMTMYDMINSHIISFVNGVVKAGKESVLFWAKDDDQNDIALKVYLVTTSNFKKRAPYILGDPRFSKIKKGTRNIVNLWAQKEFTNLSLCNKAKIPVVKPIHVSKNVLALEFVGKNGTPEKTLLESQVDYKDYKMAITILSKLYKDAQLVHGDFSEYNIFKTKNGLILFDLASAVDIRHPNSVDFLKRDINNITKFFTKRGLTVQNPIDVFEEITK
ncbi:MAG TPA: RIO1 family regulatory kinase/ATPase [Nitrosopumilaceae archaeon]|nr:RIO1 family regulatory kinase/ATPase [Nitrosopumilaceae archaeon]